MPRSVAARKSRVEGEEGVHIPSQVTAANLIVRKLLVGIVLSRYAMDLT